MRLAELVSLGIVAGIGFGAMAIYRTMLVLSPYIAVVLSGISG